MSVFRQGPRPEEKYLMVTNALARDPNIKLRTKGVYLFMRSHVDGWQMTIERIAKALGVSKDVVSESVKELCLLGYIVRYRVTDLKGKLIRVEYLILSDPLTNNQDMDLPAEKGEKASVWPHPENPDTENPDPDSPDAKEEHLKKTNVKKTIKEDLSPNGDASEGSKRNSYPESFETWWKIWPKRTSNKKSAYRQWVKAVDRIHVDDLNARTRNLRAFIDAGHQEVRFIKDAERWLRDDHWDDVLEVPQNRPQQHGGVPAGFKKINSAERRMLETQMLMSQPDPRAVEALRTGLVPISFGSMPQADTQPQLQGTPQTQLGLEIS